MGQCFLYREIMLKRQVADILRAHGFFAPDRRVLAACSGGTDSLVLLDILSDLHAAGGPQIICAHYEHGIRGAASRADADAVAAYCAARDIPCIIEAGDVPRYARTHKLSLETAARVCRYDFLHRLQEQEHCDAIALAHHADDLAETVLMRILRGTGPAGLAAMREWDGVHLRPLLHTARTEIERYIRAHELHPCHDRTNDQQNAQRNRIRHTLLPTLCTYGNRNIRDALVRLSALAGEEDDFLTQCAAAELERASSGGGLSVDVLNTLHTAMVRRVLRLFWEHEERMRRLLTRAGTAQCELPHGWRARLRYGVLRLQREETRTTQQGKEEEIFLPLTHEYDIINFQGRLFSMRRMDIVTDEDWQKAVDGKAVYADAAGLPPLVLRTRRPGDYMRLSIGRKKIKDIMIDDKIPREARDSIPLLAVAGSSEIFWMVGGRRSILAPVTEHCVVFAIAWEKESTAS